ncbi:hypothetical protein EV651_103605 [Kribbella sp. VKM Ac-2571]|uniref:hypothetical protein n=1 Tax=Kribbella sp. VKM Ac-2571 TaxID=2512222 RepID=UPI00105B4585|nr:hypothetical protein [Kribbella sp. VKM Ac-2571]TDO67691.1 hypothetical protein EV651_103605 [Kribbella sp. VKM Ac-2571]
MTQPGLTQVSPALVDKLRQSTDDQRHQLVERVCVLAVRCADVADPTLTEALNAIRSRSFGIQDLRSRLDALTGELDEIAWGIQDRVDAGDASADEYRRAFVKARAVAAIAFALDGSLAASFDSLYEAYHAIDSRDDFLRAVAD